MSREPYNALFVDFVYLLRDYGVPAGLPDLLEVNAGLERGLVKDMDDLLVLLRLSFVRRVEHMDPFERAFALYFYGVDIPAVAEGDPELLRTPQFREWLARAIEKGDLHPLARWKMSPEELMKKFWERLREQTEEHHGGSKWIGTGGTSPYGHSGFAQGGVRMYGESRSRSALKVIGERRYIAYADTNELRNETLRQALESMKHLRRDGPRTALDIDATIRRSAKEGGEIDLVFRQEFRDRMRLVLLIDNGGESMTPFVELTRLLFGKMRDRFENIETFYFHNTVLRKVFSDDRRTRPVETEKLLLRPPDTRVVMIGDASMGPDELVSPYGALSSYEMGDSEPSICRLRRLAKRFRKTVWLNPIPRTHWNSPHTPWTLGQIRRIFQMEDMTLGGIKGMVERLSDKTGSE